MMMSRVLLTRIALISVLLASLSACSWLESLRDEGTKVEPKELQKISEEVKLRQLWSVKVGDGQGDLFNRLKPALSAGRVYAAGYDGEVLAVNAEDGDRLWRVKTDYRITGAITAVSRLVLFGTENSRVVALDAENGSELWSVEVTSEVLATPATDGRLVVVQTQDGKLIGLDARNGEQRWIYENPVPALSLRGTSSPLIVEGFVLAAFGNGSVISIALDNGTLRWEERVAIPTGTSEIERLVDIDGDLYLNDGGLLIVPSYQGYAAAIDVVTGQTRWRTQTSSFVGANAGFGNVYIVDDVDTVKAYRLGQDQVNWENDQLGNRQLTAPLGFSNYLAVGDFEGYLHLLSQVDGRLVGRTRVDSDGIRARILNQGNTLFVYGNSGKLVALRVQ